MNINKGVGTFNLQADAILGYNSTTFIKSSSSGTLKMGVANSSAIGNNGKPRLINIDKSGANTEAIRIINRYSLTFKKIKTRRVKYLNNIVEQDHRTIKRRIAITTGFKEFESAQRTLAGIEIINIIRKDQLTNPKKSWFATFKSLAA